MVYLPLKDKDICTFYVYGLSFTLWAAKTTGIPKEIGACNTDDDVGKSAKFCITLSNIQRKSPNLVENRRLVYIYI